METSSQIQPRGIVTSAGGKDYFLNAYVNLRVLRDNGCRLPFFWAYMGAEMTDAMLAKAATIGNITFYNMDETSAEADFRQWRGGWQAKVKSILAAPFEEILFLDADCFPWRDPSYLFDHPTFQSHDCVFWPDPFKWKPEKLEYLRTKYNVPNLPEAQIESGQMMFHKSRAAGGLLAAKALNDNSSETYTDMYGDKDTFQIGALQAGLSMDVVPHHYDQLTHGMLHKDFDGQKLFSHLAFGKFRTHGRLAIKEQDWPFLPSFRAIFNELKSEQII